MANDVGVFIICHCGRLARRSHLHEKEEWKCKAVTYWNNSLRSRLKLPCNQTIEGLKNGPPPLTQNGTYSVVDSAVSVILHRGDQRHR